MNKIIIEQFEKLLLLIQSENDKITDEKEKISNRFRYKNTLNALQIIKKYPIELSLDNLTDFKMPGIGKKTIDRIKEILDKGKLEELKDFKINENESIINELETIVGIGRSKALEMVNDGIQSIQDLKKKIKNKEYKVNDKIVLGLKYHNKFFGNIPRKEITSIKKILDNIIKKYNKYLEENNKFVLEICGSYRREKLTSGDIDVLISKQNNDTEINYLLMFVKELKKPLKLNNNKPLITDDLTDKKYDTKYMGFIKYKDNQFRRIDIRYVNWESYYTALLYFTGSAEHNQKIRKIAQSLGYKLSEYNLIRLSDNKNILINSEEDIFKILKLNYVEPKNR